MKLFYSPGACSLAVHIALREAGADFDLESVDLKTKKTELGAEFTAINPKGYVPALVLESGEILTENLAVLDWVATQYPSLGVEGPLGRTRLIETLAFISTEIHKSFKPLFHDESADDMARARHLVAQRLQLLAARRPAPFLFGARLSVADCYLFVMLLWSMRFGIEVPEAFHVLRRAMVRRIAVQVSMDREGLRIPFAEVA